MSFFKKLSFLTQFSLLSFFAFAIIGAATTYLRTQQIRNIFFQEQERVVSATIQEHAVKILSFSSFDSEKYQENQALFAELADRSTLPETSRIHIWAKDATIIYSTAKELIGQKYPENHHLREALEGQITTEISTPQEPQEKGEPPLPSGLSLFEIYVPIVLENPRGTREVAGVVELYLRLDDLEKRIGETQAFIAATVFGSFAFLYALLFGIARAASETIRRQSRQLEEYAKGLEEKVKERTKRLEEAQAKELALKDEFVFIASHELKTPVTAIRGFLEMIFEENPSPPIRPLLESVEEAAQNLNGLVADLLEVARSEAGKLAVKVGPLDVCESIGGVISELSPLAKEKSITLESLCPQTPLMALADKEKLGEILVNLVGNSIKFTPEKGKVRVSHQTKEGKVIIEVADSGIGIPKEEQNRVFEKFWRGENASKAPGTGLGLFITKMLVEKMRGKIWFESAPGKGTTFSFSLPLAE